jgi:hypothetical protein
MAAMLGATLEKTFRDDLAIGRSPIIVSETESGALSCAVRSFWIICPGQFAGAKPGREWSIRLSFQGVL